MHFFGKMHFGAFENIGRGDALICLHIYFRISHSIPWVQLFSGELTIFVMAKTLASLKK
jgi:hypothetical protein